MSFYAKPLQLAKRELQTNSTQTLRQTFMQNSFSQNPYIRPTFIAALVFIFTICISTMSCQNNELPREGSLLAAYAKGENTSFSDPVKRTTVLINVLSIDSSGKVNTTACAGSLISRYHILTAGHCLFDVKSVSVTFHPNVWAPDKEAITIDSSSLDIHPDFDIKNLHSDLGIIELSQAAPAHYETVRLGSQKHLNTRLPVIFAGFEKDPSPKKESALNLISGLSIITQLIGKKGFFSFNETKENVILINPIKSRYDSSICPDYSGGPLFLDDIPGPRFVGVGSFTDENCRKFSAFTNIFPHWAWVKSILARTPSALLSIVAVPHKGTITPFTSEDFGENTPAKCENGTMAVGLSCAGRYCNDVALSCAGAIDKPILSQNWSGYFSEEGQNHALCETGEALTGMRCKGRFCDNISIQCSKIPDLAAENCEWSKPVSEEDGGMLELELGQYIAGIQCQGRYCDNKRAYTCMSGDKWTAYSSEENQESPKALCDYAEIVRGFACKGRYCDNIAVKCDYEKRTVIDDPEEYWSPFYSEELKQGNLLICPDGSFISGINCSGRYCDAISLHCTEVTSSAHRGCFWTEHISEENLGRLDIPKGFGAAGIRCKGSYCDDKQILVCPTHPQ